MAGRNSGVDVLRVLVGAVVNRWVGAVFLALLGGFALSGGLYSWPFYDLAKRTVFGLGCRTLGCALPAMALSIVYMVLFAVVTGAVLRAAVRR